MSVSDPNHVTCLQHLEAFIKARIPSIQAMINKQIDELESELNQIGRPLANDAGVHFSSLILYSSWKKGNCHQCWLKPNCCAVNEEIEKIWHATQLGYNTFCGSFWSMKPLLFFRC
jgi:hypothetical protein